MSFAAPLLLLGLLAIPPLALWYVSDRRAGRARAATAFAAPALAASVTPRRPGWRAHVPMLVFALALCAGVVAAARPQTSSAVALDRASIMLANDVSGSMQSTDIAPTRLGAAKQADTRFLDAVPGQVNVGVMAFNQRATVLQSPTTDRDATRAAVAELRVSGGTATGNAILTGLHLLTTVHAGATPAPAAIVLMSDGSATSGVDPIAAAQQAGREHVPIYTIALGTAQGTIKVAGADGSARTVPVPPDPGLLARIASASGGQAYTAADAEHLGAVYEHLGSQLAHRKVKHEITAGFAGAGAALLLLGCALSLRWFGRLI